ncbi:putative ubiquitin-conjugating enzyme [Trypanosoma cruzi]|uniref:E2 ubiquitin-conjugating enzyme n=2 Tax=Trypanosoma cruzi TaxID=5693 RepID=Q4CXW4_TRYCC|nr:ubiquitin-conjugating enzyme, putative [Trypanosoma cruzi]EAN85120.1 ubiquitin-conjugating enzyme, putative [Trypanosoma cruzi]KAF8297876.1 putative ubiquitin-conjugating enzyme [Trypanosoma cruzi]PWV06697.1 putative ubiquitin-conjugating enzyme [Trypanosoma cruzi]RNC55379.1 ubiquitin-conjugating enzyme [Trypanosoma cruzi]|eukprot:XP_806971.1 ubiquitin-conjugating enzyme [Trypanosoma cruzi strain CL Brener]
MSIGASAMRLIMRQIQDIEANPTDGVQIHRSDNLSELLFDLTGPEGTPFSGGIFHVVLYFEEGYPEIPPRGVFRTKIFHPNVAEKGDICVNVLKQDWKPSLGLRHVLTVIRCLLIEPNAESALNEEAARLLLEDYDAYRRKAEMMTKIHAMKGTRAPHDVPPPFLSDDGRENGQLLSRGTANVGSASLPASEGFVSSQLRNASESALNKRSAVGGTSTNVVASKKAVEKKRAALKRI